MRQHQSSQTSYNRCCHWCSWYFLISIIWPCRKNICSWCSHVYPISVIWETCSSIIFIGSCYRKHTIISRWIMFSCGIWISCSCNKQNLRMTHKNIFSSLTISSSSPWHTHYICTIIYRYLYSLISIIYIFTSRSRSCHQHQSYIISYRWNSQGIICMRRNTSCSMRSMSTWSCICITIAWMRIKCTNYIFFLVIVRSSKSIINNCYYYIFTSYCSSTPCIIRQCFP